MLRAMSAKLDEIRKTLETMASQRDREGDLLDAIDALLKTMGEGGDPDALERATRAAAEFDRAGAAAARARQDLSDALAALAEAPVDHPEPTFRPATPTVKVRAVPPLKIPDGDGRS